MSQYSQRRFVKRKKFKKIYDSEWENDMPIGKLTVIPNFLPPPDQLILPGEIVKITISLDQESLLFFKEMAEKFGTKYQRMIREVLRRYVKAYKQK